MAKIVEVTNPVTGQPTQVDQLDHTAQQIDDAIARALPGGAIDSVLSSRVNPNLLDNWYFGNPVNQRGQTEYTGNGYMVDRWLQGFDGTLTSTLTDDGIKIAAGNDGTYKNFEQVLPYVPTNTTFTMSFLVDNFASINQIYTSFSASQFDIRDNIITYTFKTGGSISGRKVIGIQVKLGKTVTIKAAKLELGDTQTLARQENGVWVLNEIPDYGEQLQRCQRYAIDLAASEDRTYGIVGVGVAVSQSKVQFMVPLPTTMRARPVAKFYGTWKFVHGTDTNYGLPVTTISVDSLSTNTVVLDTFTNENLITGDTYMLWRSNDSNNSLLLSADL